MGPVRVWRSFTPQRLCPVHDPDSPKLLFLPSLQSTPGVLLRMLGVVSWLGIQSEHKLVMVATRVTRDVYVCAGQGLFAGKSSCTIVRFWSCRAHVVLAILGRACRR